MARTEIQTCPCCGETAGLAYYTNEKNEPYSTYVVCSNCGLKTKAIPRDIAYDAEEEAITLWNTRA